MMHPVIPYVIAAGMFGLGCYGVLVRRNAVLVLMAVELMLNAVNLVLVTADTTVRAASRPDGQVFALFVIVLAAAEIGIGLAVVLRFFRMRQSVVIDEVSLDSGPDFVHSELPGEVPGDGGGDLDSGVPVGLQAAAEGNGRHAAGPSA
jgi:NADH-quinone oxidoreductase subunit K